MSTDRYRVRDLYSVLMHESPMGESADWKVRLEEAVKRDGRSRRELSLAAGMSYNYISQMLSDKKMPKIENFNRVCEALGVSPAYIWTGVEMTARTQAMIEAFERLPAPEQSAFLTLLLKEPKA